MDIYQILIAVSLGLLMGWLLTRNKNVDYSKIHTINEKDFKDNMRKGQLIDIRKKEVYANGHIKGSKNIHPSQLNGKYVSLRKDQSVYLYCDNGKKSKKVAKKLIRKQFSDVYILDNGYDGLTK